MVNSLTLYWLAKCTRVEAESSATLYFSLFYLFKINKYARVSATGSFYYIFGLVSRQLIKNVVFVFQRIHWTCNRTATRFSFIPMGLNPVDLYQVLDDLVVGISSSRCVWLEVEPTSSSDHHGEPGCPVCLMPAPFFPSACHPQCLCSAREKGPSIAVAPAIGHAPPLPCPPCLLSPSGPQLTLQEGESRGAVVEHCTAGTVGGGGLRKRWTQ
jgi:hypothetical protein